MTLTSLVELRTEFGLSCWSGPCQPMPQSHRHIDLEINLIERGQFVYLLGGKRVYVESGQLALFWAAMPHQLIEVAPDTYTHWLTMPLAWFLKQSFSTRLTKPVLEGLLLITPAREFEIALFTQWSEDLFKPSNERCTVVYLELEARLRRWGWSLQESTRMRQMPVSDIHSSDKAENMANWIANHYTEQITVVQIADAVSLHPNYAMKLFRRKYGITIIDYVTQHRIALAQQLLVTTDHDVLSIALQSGFGSSSQFYTVFKRLCGRAPRAYRTSLR
jgi:AraC family transcriptional regulator, melibiose operon regulatory protein